MNKPNPLALDHLIGTKTYDAAFEHPGLFAALVLFEETYQEMTGKKFAIEEAVISKIEGDFVDRYVFVDTIIGDKRLRVQTHYALVGFEIAHAAEQENDENVIAGSYMIDFDEEPDLEAGMTRWDTRTLPECTKAHLIKNLKIAA